MPFDSAIGIDYSGAKTSTDRLRGLQVYAASRGEEPSRIAAPPPGRNWSRKEVAHWLLGQVRTGNRLVIGVDHGFSFPLSYFDRYDLASWDEFLADFCRHWPTDAEGRTVEEFRPGTRTGESSELRLAERWTASAKSVFQFDMQGSVAKSTHAGLPWLWFLRREAGKRLFFWPFDGWQPPGDCSMIAETFPSLFRRRYPRSGRSADEQDAYAVARWLAESDRRGILERYWMPPLTPAERRVAEREGWVLGVA